MNPLLYVDKLLSQGGPRVNAVLALLAGFTLGFAVVWMTVKADPAMGTQFGIAVGALSGIGGGTYIASKIAQSKDTPNS